MWHPFWCKEYRDDFWGQQNSAEGETTGWIGLCITWRHTVNASPVQQIQAAFSPKSCMKHERTECYSSLYKGATLCFPCEMRHVSLGHIHSVLCSMEGPENSNPKPLEWDIKTGSGNVVPNSLCIAPSELWQKKKQQGNESPLLIMYVTECQRIRKRLLCFFCSVLYRQKDLCRQEPAYLAGQTGQQVLKNIQCFVTRSLAIRMSNIIVDQYWKIVKSLLVYYV